MNYYFMPECPACIATKDSIELLKQSGCDVNSIDINLNEVDINTVPQLHVLHRGVYKVLMGNEAIKDFAKHMEKYADKRESTHSKHSKRRKSKLH